jgi:hypothetical protein
MLRGRFPVHDPDGYLEKRGDITFAVYQHYTVEHQKPELEQAMRAKEPLPSPRPTYQDVALISEEMAEAMRAFVAQHPTFRTEFPELGGMESRERITSPHIWWYHYRKSHNIQDLPPRQAELVKALTHWIETSSGSLYDRIDHQFRQGRVSHESVEYLVRPGHALVLEDDGKGLPMGYLATTRPKLSPTQGLSEPHETLRSKVWEIGVQSYAYTGEFSPKNETLTLDFEDEAEDGEVDIASLKYVPLTHANDEIKEVLERRGKTFWKCRSKRLVSYEGSSISKDKKHAVRRIAVLPEQAYV